MWIELLTTASIVVGTLFVLIAAIGLYRLEDFYTRIHAPTKAATLGLAALLFAVALSVHEEVVITKALLALGFVAVTAPVSAHILSRAAYRNGVRPNRPFHRDDYRRAIEEGRASVQPGRKRDLTKEE